MVCLDLSYVTRQNVVFSLFMFVVRNVPAQHLSINSLIQHQVVNDGLIVYGGVCLNDLLWSSKLRCVCVCSCDLVQVVRVMAAWLFRHYPHLSLRHSGAGGEGNGRLALPPLPTSITPPLWCRW